MTFADRVKLYTRAMTSVSRILLIWLALAIPLQGAAAATMQFCASSHHAQAANRQEAHHHASVTATDHAHHAARDAAPCDGSDPQGDAASKAKCSVCAACCVASALLPNGLTVPAVMPLHEAPRLVSTTYVGPVASCLERPPRPELA